MRCIINNYVNICSRNCR